MHAHVVCMRVSCVLCGVRGWVYIHMITVSVLFPLCAGNCESFVSFLAHAFRGVLASVLQRGLCTCACVMYPFFSFFILCFYMWPCVGCWLVPFACVCLLELACVHSWTDERMVAFLSVCGWLVFLVWVCLSSLLLVSA